jgi:hypothetical protein
MLLCVELFLLRGYHLLKMIDALRSYVNGVLEGLEVLPKTLLNFSDSGSETVDNSLNSAESEIDVVRKTTKILCNYIHAWQLPVDQRMFLHELCSTKRAEAIPHAKQEIVSLA